MKSREKLGILAATVIATVLGGTQACPAEESKPATELPSSARGLEVYSQRCVACHGFQGQGDGPLGKNLSKRPRNFTDLGWQQAATDTQIADAIRKGGYAVGLSPLMPSLGRDLTELEIQSLVLYIRTLINGPKSASRVP